MLIGLSDHSLDKFLKFRLRVARISRNFNNRSILILKGVVCTIGLKRDIKLTEILNHLMIKFNQIGTGGFQLFINKTKSCSR